MFNHRRFSQNTQKTRRFLAGLLKSPGYLSALPALFLPSALLVAVRLEALPAFVFRHLQTSFLLKISHGESWF